MYSKDSDQLGGYPRSFCWFQFKRRDKGAYLIISERYFLSYLYKYLWGGCSLESPRRGDSNEHIQHRFL